MCGDCTDMCFNCGTEPVCDEGQEMQLCATCFEAFLEQGGGDTDLCLNCGENFVCDEGQEMQLCASCFEDFLVFNADLDS